MDGGLCYFHANPNKASELGQRGGKAKGPKVKTRPPAAGQLATLEQGKGEVCPKTLGLTARRQPVQRGSRSILDAS